MKIALISISIIFTLASLWIIAFVCYFLYKKRQLYIADKIDLSLPKSWKDLTADQLKYVCTLMLHDNTPTEIHTKCFIYFTGIKVLCSRLGDVRIWICRKGKQRFEIAGYEVQSFAWRLSWLTETISEITPLPEIAGCKHINPRFEGVPFKQWMAAENYYQAFIFTKNNVFLQRLCAVVYSAGTVFNDKETAKRSLVFMKASETEQLSVFLYYAGLKEQLSVQFKYLFQKINTSTADGNAPKLPNMRRYFNDMVYALNGGDVTKTSVILDNTECWNAFDTLDRKAQENKETADRLQKMKGGKR